MRAVLISVFLLLVCPYGQSLSLINTFNVVCKGESIGQLEVTKTINDDVIDFKYLLDITTTVIFKEVRVQYDMDAQYSGGNLLNYHLIYKVNEKVHDEVLVDWNEDHYTIQSTRQKQKKDHFSLINFTTVLLFFSEPLKRTKVWGELNCRYQPLIKVEDNGYEMSTDDGRSNVFYYEKGKLVRATFDTPVVDFEIIKSSETKS